MEGRRRDGGVGWTGKRRGEGKKERKTRRGQKTNKKHNKQMEREVSLNDLHSNKTGQILVHTNYDILNYSLICLHDALVTIWGHVYILAQQAKGSYMFLMIKFNEFSITIPWQIAQYPSIFVNVDVQLINVIVQ